MSNSLAIAAVTSSIASVITNAFDSDLTNDPELLGYTPPPTAGTIVTTKPPDAARVGRDDSQLNLFLYHLGPNAAWRNHDMPSQTQRGEVGSPPLALDLYYLLTAYGAGNNDLIAHRLLGRAMRALYDHPVLMSGDIPTEVGSPPVDLSLSGLGEQPERVRLVPHAMPMEELSRLWQTFQTQYRTSAVYKVSVVLIESRRPVRASLPVLRRGTDDRGVDVGPSLTAATFPCLLALDTPAAHGGVLPGETFTLRGVGFAGATVTVTIEHQALHAPHSFAPVTATSDTTLAVAIPSTGTLLPAGVSLVSAKIERAGRAPVTTNALPLLVMPEIVGAPAVAPGTGHQDVTVTFTPPVRQRQRVSLLLGETEYLAPGAADDTPRSAITFAVPDAVVGKFLARLRVDGVDSAIVDRSTTPPTFLDCSATLP